MANSSGKVSKRFGGVQRAEVARKHLKDVFSSDTHPLHFAKDIDLAKLFDVSRHTVYKIRDEMGVGPRSKRIITKLKSLDLKSHTIRELSKILNIKYQNLYKLMTEAGLKAKDDIAPIEHLKKYHEERKKNKPPVAPKKKSPRKKKAG